MQQHNFSNNHYSSDVLDNYDDAVLDHYVLDNYDDAVHDRC